MVGNKLVVDHLSGDEVMGFIARSPLLVHIMDLETDWFIFKIKVIQDYFL